VEFLAAIVILAIVPAIGEELLFRGILQNKIEMLSKNKHIAIWITAFIFSFIHFQFYGFVPRLLLGALFGYLYIWSGNLTIPILAHFINNGFTLLLLYAGVNFEMSVPMEITILSFILVISFLYIFKKTSTEKNYEL
jgi:membrane protease YdiL (CAAX protease family)